MERICPDCGRIFYCLGNCQFESDKKFRHDFKNTCICISCFDKRLKHGLLDKKPDNIPEALWKSRIENAERCRTNPSYR